MVVAGAMSTRAASEPRITESFEQTPLKEVFAILKRKYQVRIAFSERLVKGVTVTGEFRDLGVDRVLQVLLEGTRVTHEFIFPNAIIIKKKPADQQQRALSGVLRDNETGEQLPFALVSEVQSGRSTTTNEDGFFSLVVTDDSVQLNVSYIGYADTTIFVGGPTTRRLNIELSPSYNQLGEVVVTGASDNISSPDGYGEIDLNPKLVRRMPQTAERDVFRLLQLLPGVSGANELSSGLSIHGGTANQNLILFDGFSVYHQDHLFGYFSAINPYAVKSVRTLKTGYPANYGGRSSGVVQFTGNDGSASRFSGRFAANLLSFNGALETPLGANTTVFLSGRRSHTDFIQSFLFDRIFNLYARQLAQEDAVVEDQKFDPDFYYDDFNFKLSTKLNPRDLVSLSFYQSDDRLAYNEEITLRYPEDTLNVNDDRGVIDWGNLGASLRFARIWNNTDASEVILNFSDYSSNYEEFSEQRWYAEDELFEETDLTTMQSNGIRDLGIKVSQESSFGNFTLNAGAEASLFNVALENVQNNELLTSKNQRDFWIGTVYLQSFTSISPRLRLGLGSRVNYSNGRSKTYWEPRFSLSYKPNERWVFRTSTGIYSQFINQVNTRNVLQGSRDLWVLADETVPVQIASHFSIGGNYSLQGFSFDFNLYHRRFQGVLDYAFQRGNLITEYTDYEQLFFEGDGRGTGLELLVKKETPHFVTWLGYTVSKVQNRFSQLNQGRWFAADHDQRHEINVYLSRKVKNFNVFASWVFATGRPWSEFLQQMDPQGRETGVILVNSNNRNSERLPAYDRLDVGVSSTWELAGVTLEASAHIFNLYDKDNVHSIQLVPLPAPMNRGPASPPPPPPPPPPGGGPGGPDGMPPPPPPRDMRSRGPGELAFTNVENGLMGFTPSLSLEIRF